MAAIVRGQGVKALTPLSRLELAAEYKTMYEKRAATNPAAFKLDYWKDHFALQTISRLNEIRGNVLDLGCGTGEIDILLARTNRSVRIVGVDICTEALSIAEKHRSLESGSIKERISFCESLIEQIPFKDNSFDVCFISHTLEHIKDHGPIFRELYRVLKPQGTVVAIVPLGHFHEDPTHIWHFQVGQLQKHLELFGSNVEVWRSQDGQQLAAKMTLWKKPKIIGMMRIKNEERWIMPTLEKASPLVEGFVILDDGSTDRTSELCRCHPKVIRYEYQNEPVTDEVRDKNRLLHWTLDENPDWILALDGDELLEDVAPLTIWREIALCPNSVTKLGFDFLYIWDSENLFRSDGVYTNLRHLRLFRAKGVRIDSRALFFSTTDHGANFHCGSIPSNLSGEIRYIDVKVKHFGYYERSRREEKRIFYEQKDPQKAASGYYRHLTDEEGLILLTWRERTVEEILYSDSNPFMATETLKNAANPLWLAGLFYLPGSQSHLDIGSNTGDTLRGLLPASITCIEKYKPAVQHLQKLGIKVHEGDAVTIVESLVKEKVYFDRVTMFDFIEHLNKTDGEKLLDEVEKIAVREIVLFVPMENEALTSSEQYNLFMTKLFSTIPKEQHNLQGHRSHWHPDEFRQRGYHVLTIEDFHMKGFHAFFAVKFRFMTDQELIFAGINRGLDPDSIAKGCTPVNCHTSRTDRALMTSSQTSTSAFGRLGHKSQVSNPLLITNADRIFIGDNVFIRDGARLEAITAYAGAAYHPTLLIEDGVSMEPSVHIGAARYIRIGKNSMIAGRVTILDHDHGYEDISIPPLEQPLTIEEVDIDDNVWLGENVCVCKGVRIGKHAIIGANSVVTSDIPSYSVACGNPAKVIKFYNFEAKGWQTVSEKTIQKALKERAAFAARSYELAQRLVAQKDYPAAIDVLNMIVCFHKENALYHNDLGVLFYQSGELQKARRHYEEAVRLQPNNITFLKNLADFYYVEMKRVESSSLLYEKIIEFAPQDIGARLMLGNFSILQNKFEKARAMFLSILEIDPTHEQAGRLFDSLTAKTPNGEMTNDPMELLREARSCAQRHQPDRAIQLLERLVAVWPDHAIGHNELGNLYGLIQEAEKAIHHLGRAVQLEPGQMHYLRDLADTHLIGMGNIEEAFKLYNRVLALKPDDVDTLQRIGNVCAMQKQLEDARFFYNKVLLVDPGNPQARENLAVLQDMSGRAVHCDESRPGDHGEMGVLAGNHLTKEGHDSSVKQLKRATIIIPVFNQLAYTKRCLECLYQNTSPDRIHGVVIVDNASSDGSREFLELAKTRYPKLSVLTNAENLFFAKACNQGADSAGGDYLVFLNNDTEPLQGWLERVLQRLETDDTIGIVGSKLIYPDGTIQHAGIEFLPTPAGKFSCWPSHRFRHQPGDHPDANQAAEVPAVTGACLAIRREMFRSIGGFSCDYKMYFEDLDLNFKARRAGKRIYYEPASVVVHHEGKSSPGQQDIDRLNLRSAELFFSTWKNFFEIQPSSAAASEKPSIVWLAPLFNPSGYCSEAMAFIHGLANKARLEIGNISNIYSKNFVEGLTPELEQLLKNLYREKIDFGNKIAVMHFPGYSFSKNSEAVYTIGRTMFETDSLPADWVDKCNQMDEIWVPSKFNLETFARAGVNKEKLLLIPEPVDTQFFSPENARTDPNKSTAGYKFLSIFEWSARKGWDVLLEAYFREFSRADNVSLTIKTYLLHAPDGDAEAKIRDTIRSLAGSLELNVDELPSFEIITRQLDYRQLPIFYGAFDCLVIPSRGEGWGRPYCEAMSMGLPVIATNWSGNTEFMNAGNSFLVRVEGLKEIESSEIGFYKGHKWAQPSVEHLRELMRQLYNDPALGKAKGLQARQDMVRYYSCDVVGDRARDRLSEIRDALAHRRHAVRQAPQQVDRALTHLHIGWEGAQFVTHSLALVNRELCLQLIENGCQVSVIPIERDAEALGKEPRFKPIVERIKTAGSLKADVHVRHQWPPNFDPPRAGYWVMIQPWEFGSIPKEWVQPMSESVDEVWVPSRYVRDCYIASGIPGDRVYVVHNGVDTKRFHPEAAVFSLMTKKTFKFLFVGGTIKRKGIDLLIDAYAAAFSNRDDVCLVIKDMGGDSFYKGQTASDLIEQCRSIPDSPEIEYIDRSLSEPEMAGLYTACNCLVHPYRGEGFGLPIAEAMASQLPVIVTGYGAALDFCTKDNSYLIPAKRLTFTDKKVGRIETVDYPWLVEPDREALIFSMRHVMDNPEEAMAKAKSGRFKIACEFGWAQSAEAVMQRLNALALKPVVRFHDNHRRDINSNKPTASIIIRVLDDRITSKKCLKNIRKHTQTAYEIILVVSARSPKALKWAKQMAKEAGDIKSIETVESLGWARAINAGIEASSGSYLVILDSSAIVHENWLSDLLEAAARWPNRGIVGAVLNHTVFRSGSKRIHPMLSKEEDLESWRQHARHRRIITSTVEKECMLVDRRLLDAIGMMDERFDDGHCGAKDLCYRAQLAGFENIIAGDVPIQLQSSSRPAGGQRKAGEAATRVSFDQKWNDTDWQQSVGSKRMKIIALNRAEYLCAQGKMDQAIQIMLEAIKHSASDRGLYLKLSELLIEGKRHADAREILTAMPESVSDARQLALLGYCEEALGNDEKAQEYAERALAIDPQAALSMNVLGVLAFKKGERATAEGWFRKAVESDPGFGESYTNMGSLKWAAGQSEAAMELFERGFILSPTIDDVAEAYHTAIVATKSFETAEPVFREARALHPSHKRIAFLMIALLLQQEKHESAISEIEKAMLQFGIDDGILSAGLEVRKRIGALQIDKSKHTKATLSLCMIVKNEEAHLAKCLMSVKPIVDEMIVVDTGSSDRSKDIAALLGARVFEFPWTNDFSEARNYSLSHTSGDWVLVLDADEVISPQDYEKISRITRRKPTTSLAYSMVTRNYTDQAGSRGWVENEGHYAGEETGKGWVPSPKVRLFANHRQIRFTNPVHELVEPALERLGIGVKECNVPVHHYGRLDRDKLLAKGKEYFRLGLAKIEQCKGDGKALRELAIQASEIGEYDEAVRIWKQVLAVQPNDAVAHMNMGFAYLMMRQYAETISASRKAMELDPGLREAVINYSAAEMIAGDIRTAISTLEALLKNNPNYPPAMGRLATAYLVAGRKEEGLHGLKGLKARGFDCAGAIMEQAQSFIAENKIKSAALLLESAIESGTANGDCGALLAKCRMRIDSGAQFSPPFGYRNQGKGPTIESSTHANQV